MKWRGLIVRKIKVVRMAIFIGNTMQEKSMKCLAESEFVTTGTLLHYWTMGC